jgi:4-carboxymuconolactone decarboxylase
MDQERFAKGLAKRKATLGADYVEKTLSQADDFSRPFQEMMTVYCWGFGWGDETLDAKTRSMLNLTMIAALNRMHEWELHLNGAIGNGVTRDEIRAVLHQISIYCGVPAGVECFRIAKRVFAEHDGKA